MRGLCAFFLSMIIHLSIAQDYPRRDVNPQLWSDNVFANPSQDLNYQSLYENYLQLISHPLDLNQATEEELRRLQVLSEQELKTFLAYRQQAAPILSVYELQVIYDRETFLRLIPFVTVADPANHFRHLFRRMASQHNRYLILRWGRTLETQRGYTAQASPSQHYLGTPDQWYARLRASQPSDYSVGFTVKKDAGEQVQWNPAGRYYGADFISFHLQASQKGRVRNLILGDYQAQFGQGIALGSYFGIGKSGEPVMSMRRVNVGFSPYTSLYEGGYFRGAAVSYQLTPKMTLHVFGSHRRRDGRIQSDSTSSFLSSFNASGLHRTASELSQRNMLTESNEGLVLQFRSRGTDAGFIAHHTSYGVPVHRSPTAYNQFTFDGQDNTNIGGYFNTQWGNVSFFSEVSQTLRHGRAMVAGVLLSATAKLDLSLLLRSYDLDYTSFYSNAIAEGTSTQNERGMYWGWKYTFSKQYSLAGYVDLFSFPWLRYRNYSAADGSDWLVRFNWQPDRRNSLFIQLRQEVKWQNAPDAGPSYAVQSLLYRAGVVNLTHQVSNHLELHTRVQANALSSSSQTTRGLVLLQDVHYRWRRLTFSGRIALFDTDSYANRLYVYEPDAPMSYSFPAYSGKGSRQVVSVQFRFSKQLDGMVRWARTEYADRNQIGSGGEMIDGHSENDIKFQARITF